jgi:hypothetical protein
MRKGRLLETTAPHLITLPLRMVADPMRIVAIVCGCVASIGAAVLLLQDAFRSGHWTVEHLILPILMLVSILTGHLFNAAIRDWRPLSALGFLIVSTASMCAIVYTSVGNQSQVTETKTLAAESNNAERATLLKERAREVDMLVEERQALARECGTGKGPKCDGKTVTVGTYENAVVGIDTKLARIGPEVPVQVKADKMAALIAALCNRDQSMVKRFLLLIEPFTYSLIFEVCALVSFSFGFSHRRQPSKAEAEPRQTDTNGWYVHNVTLKSMNRSTESFNEPKPFNRSTNKPSAPLNRPVEPSQPSKRSAEPSNGAQRRPSTRDEALAALLTDLALGRGFSSQEELAERFNKPKSTISVWLKDWTKQGLIPERSVRGRCKSISV